MIIIYEEGGDTMFFLANCDDIYPILHLLKKGVIPVIQVGIIAVLVILLIIDFGKAVMAGKEDEIKSAQKLAIKRVVYALVVFLVPWIVNIAIGLLADATDKGGTNVVETDDNGQRQDVSALTCWKNA